MTKKEKNDQPTPDTVSTAPSTIQFELMVSPVNMPLFEHENLSHFKQHSSVNIENINIEIIDGVNNNHGNDDQISPFQFK
jgi:hypothetical protein